MKSLVLLTLCAQVLGSLAQAAPIFIESASYSLTSKSKLQREKCPEGQIMEVSDGGETQLVLGPNIVIPLSPLKSKEVVPDGCTYERETKISQSEIIFTSTRSNCKESGMTVERVKKSGASELIYEFRGPKKVVLKCRLKKEMAKAEGN